MGRFDKPTIAHDIHQLQHRGAALAIAQDIAFATKRQVDAGELEAVVAGLHRAKAFESDVLLRCRHEEHLGGFLAATDATAQLVELRETEAVGVLHDHDGRVRDVHAHLDDRGGDQNLRLVIMESLHDLLFLGRWQAAVQKLDLPIEKRAPLEHLRLARRRGNVIVLQVGVVLDGDRRVVRPTVGLLARRGGPLPRHRVALLGVLAHKRAHDIHLLAAPKRLAGSVVGVPALRLREHARRAARRVMRAMFQVRERQVPEQRERERARNRRRREEEGVGRIALGEQFRTLSYAEALLLVDHGERKVVRAHVVLEQRMRADEHVEAASGEAGEQLSPLGFRGRPGEHRMGDSRRVKELA